MCLTAAWCNCSWLNRLLLKYWPIGAALWRRCAFAKDRLYHNKHSWTRGLHFSRVTAHAASGWTLEGAGGGFLTAWQQERPLTLGAVTSLARSTSVWMLMNERACLGCIFEPACSVAMSKPCLDVALGLLITCRLESPRCSLKKLRAEFY